MDELWTTLGLEATKDVSAIKRAYAEKAKTCHPEEDPEGFLRLRKAYQTALDYAEGTQNASGFVLEELEEERRKGTAVRPGGRSLRPPVPKGTASNEMCTFLIINISSLQLIPVNIIAYRSQYGSVNPAAVVGPGIVAMAVSTLAAVVFCKVMERKRRV